MALTVYPDRLRRDIAAAVNNAAVGGKVNAAFNLVRQRFPVGSTIQLLRRVTATGTDVVVFSVTTDSPLTVSGGTLYLPMPYGTATTFVAADIDTGFWTFKLGFVGEFIRGTVTKTGGAGPFFLTGDLDTTLGFSIGSVAMTVPASIDQSSAPAPTPVPAPAPAPAPAGATTTWLQAAQTDMRKNPASYTGDYAQSYAVNDARLRLRNETNYSSQSEKASLAMGRFGTSQAFTTTNPDFVLELQSWYTRSHGDIPIWPEIISWDQLFQSEEGNGDGATGYIGNTRVLLFNKQIWIKKFSTGQWHRIAKSDYSDGEVWRPNFQEYGGNKPVANGGNFDFRSETAGVSVRTNPAIGSDRYWVPHTYFGKTTVDPRDVSAVCSTGCTSLILHDSNRADDRDASRFLYAIGADWYPPRGEDGKYTAYFYGIGTPRHKYVRAKWPAFQYHVMHTETWANITASYPNIDS